MPPSRRLAAIMFTDLVGYTAATQSDEAASLTALREQERLLRPLFATYEGREVKSTGDGFLVEFESALRAVECAIAAQQRVHERNAQRGAAPIRVRIGIHLGDVEERNGDVFGDSVNVAARTEPLAEPGGICITEPVFGQVRNKISNRLERLEPGGLKDVRFPVNVYRVVLPWLMETEGEAPKLSTTPRIVVLPFANLSSNPDDSFFASGVTEELISAISRVPGLSVISRTSAMRYPPGSKPLKEIGAELGVGYALEGSVRKAGGTVRITAQLVEVSEDRHLWAESYDRTLENVFAVQIDVAQRVAEVLRSSFSATPRISPERREPRSVDAYLLYLRGRTSMASGVFGVVRATHEFELALEKDPEYAPACAALGECYIYQAGETLPDSEGWSRATHYAQKAVKLDPELPEAHASLGILILQHELDVGGAEAELRRALALDPNNTASHLWLSTCLILKNRTDEALREMRIAEELDPVSPFMKWFVGYQLASDRRYDEAQRKCEESLHLDPHQDYPHAILSVIYRLTSRAGAAIAEGQKALDEVTSSPFGLEALGCAYAVAGDFDKARAVIAQLEQLAARGLSTTTARALIELNLGNRKAALRLVEKADRENDAGLLFRFGLGVLDGLRSEPRLQGIAQRRGWVMRTEPSAPRSPI